LQTVNKNKTSEFKQHDNVFKTCGDYMLKDARISRALPLESSLKFDYQLICTAETLP